MNDQNRLIEKVLEIVNDDLRFHVSEILQLEQMKIPASDSIDIESLCRDVRTAMELFDSAWDKAFMLNERWKNEN